MSRRPFVGGNWKSNLNKAGALELVADLNEVKVPSTVDVVIAPVFIHIPDVAASLTNSSIQISSQNVSATKTGAYTGEISATQLLDYGVQWVIVGHSERRTLFADDNQAVQKKVQQALKNNLKVVFCIGETLEERKEGDFMNKLTTQLEALASIITPEQYEHIVIAYEPIWAIGTGVVASPKQAEEAHAAIRKWLNAQVSAEVGSTMRIIYGGSVKVSNYAELIVQPNVDGFLIGGASLEIKSDFGPIVEGIPSKL